MDELPKSLAGNVGDFHNLIREFVFTYLGLTKLLTELKINSPFLNLNIKDSFIPNMQSKNKPRKYLVIEKDYILKFSMKVHHK